MTSDLFPDRLNIISLGAGVQSSTMALMAAAGDITPMPAAAVFADTRAEPDSVYQWLEWLEKQLPFPIYRVSRGSLSEESTKVHISKKTGRKFTSHDVPCFTLSSTGVVGRANRSCTLDFKVIPILAKLRELGHVRRGQKDIGVTQWMGISLDELYRMKPSRVKWCENRFPLVDARMTRRDCIAWMLDHGFHRPPRSACVFCPFHNSNEWRRLKYDEPEAFHRAIQFELDIQKAKASTDNFRTVPFLHRSCKPLSEVDFSTEEERGQGNLWNNECEGQCGI